MSGMYSTLKRLSKAALHTNDELERRYIQQLSSKDLFERLLQEGELCWFSQQTQCQPESQEIIELALSQSPYQIGCARCGRLDCLQANGCLTDNISQCGPLCYCSHCLIRSEKVAAPKIVTQEMELSNSKSVRCKCKHSGCVKKYCQCYKLGQECGKDCGCHDCGNKGHLNRETKMIEEC